MKFVSVSQTEVNVYGKDRYTSGMVGAQIDIQYDCSWEGFTKTVCFNNGVKQIDDVSQNTTIEIPPEMFEQPGKNIRIGFYGTKDGVSTPTVWANLGFVVLGTDPCGDESTDATLPVYSQILEKIGNNHDLNTDCKENLVCAVNEIDSEVQTKQPKDFMVTMNYDDVPDHSSQEIYDAHKAGRTVKLIRNRNEYRLNWSVPRLSRFEFVSFSETQINKIVVSIEDMETTVTAIPYVPKSAGQSDWNQNDETAPDYVKNHPGIKNGIGADSETFNNIVPEKATGKNSHIEGGQSYLKEYQGVTVSNINAVEQTYEISVDINKDVFPHIMQFWQSGELKFAFITRSYDKSSGFVVASYSDISALTPGTYDIKLISGLAMGDRSHVEGNNNIANARESHVEGWNNMVTEWVDGNGKKVGDGVAAHAEGRETRAIGRASHVEGRLSKAIGAHSHAEGDSTTASGNGSHAEGYGTTASGYASHAEGYGTTASGNGSHAEGRDTTASGDYDSHAEGRSTTASGNGSHAEGRGTTASGDGSHAEGDSTTASGNDSHAEGDSTTASGNDSHAEGYYTTASGHYGSHTEGRGTTASGNGSHAEGLGTTAYGNSSHAEGWGTNASGETSHAEGRDTTASGDYQHTQGRNNIDDPTGKYAHIVGNGTHDVKSNAHTLDWNGNTWYQGKIKVGGTGWDDPKAVEIGSIMTARAVCHDPAAPASSTPNTWYITKDMPRPSGNVGLMIDVFWEHGRSGGLGYNAKLIWGEPGSADNETIIEATSVTDSLTGEYSIPTEGTVRYQLEEVGGRMHWRYVSGPLLPKQFSTATAAAIADKTVPGMSISYLPGMEIYVQLDSGNSADLMRLVPDDGPTLPVYGNGTGATTGTIPAGAILHLVNAGDHWQIINGGSSSGSGGDRLPPIGPESEGAFLRAVGGKPVWQSVPSAKGVSF